MRHAKCKETAVMATNQICIRGISWRHKGCSGVGDVVRGAAQVALPWCDGEGLSMSTLEVHKLEGVRDC